MHDLPRSSLILYLLAAVAVLALGVRALATSSAKAPAGAAGPPPASAIRLVGAGGGVAVVHVAGAVRRPGVYRLRAGSRVENALGRAGGPTRVGDPDAINLAARIADGQQIVVPARVTAAAGTTAAGTPDGAGLSMPVNLNTATAEQLDQLDGVGPATAQKILAWRREHGGFRSIDDLAQVPGIGPRRLAALRPHVIA